MYAENVFYTSKVDTAPIYAAQSGNMPIMRVVTGRTLSLTMTLVFNDGEVQEMGDLRKIPDRIIKALGKPEVARTILDEVKRSRAYGEED